ncbi:uncharacterized protein LOC129618625 isoform X1 [Condylostylus longicornis]|uniref:uncharacterized protein LOC129618625 isoform X1 n=1 Tax=Condylostylus longicornis TaxID=2530218 RepID=UPI00244E3F2E|nr:uncharacterized protein LOC129618625 isoform X1 [Condylostylus longicornis]
MCIMYIKNKKIYSLNSVVGGQQPQANSIRTLEQQNPISDSEHIRYAPQDPFATADDQNNLGRSEFVPQPTIRTTTTTTRRPIINNIGIDYEELNKQQAQHAHYQFDSSVQDEINDHSHTRTEQRDGLKVTGMYSYSDGFFHRTVHYIADENGYRIVKEQAEKIGEGPQFNADGVADVKSSLIGGYSIKIDDRERNPHYVGLGNAPPQ